MQWLAADLVKGYSCLSLVGDAHCLHVKIVPLLHLVEAFHHIVVDVLGIMLNPAGLLRNLLVVSRCHIKHFQVLVDN